MKIFFAGQQTLSNRGCEALVVSTIEMLTEVKPDATFVIPSTDIARDTVAMSKYGFKNFILVPAPQITFQIRLWNRLMRSIPYISIFWVPSKMKWAQETLDQLRSSDRVLHIGGDTYSYDYSYAGLISNTAQIDEIAAIGKPQEIWCATVGPFDTCPPLERRMIKKFKKLDRITLREIESKIYLEGKGVSAILAADPAFSLQPKENSIFYPDQTQKTIVVNVSPYIYRNTSKNLVDTALRVFVKKRIKEGYKILFLSHVNTKTSSDTAIIRDVFKDMLNEKNVELIPEELTAAQFKGIVSKSDFVVASRTHVTIAGFSSSVPVLSIAYSAKASRLNRFLFENESYVINAWDITTESLENTFQQVKSNREVIRKVLLEKSQILRQAFRDICKKTTALK